MMYEAPSIIVYRTHIEIFPYKKGQCYKLEKMLSTYDYVCHKWTPVAYHIEKNTLYIPAGVSKSLLSKLFYTDVIYSKSFDPLKKFSDGKPLYDAKTDIQQEAINFLIGAENFGYTLKCPQISVNIDTGDGKTYSAVYAILKYKYKAIIITHTDNIKAQWYKSFTTMTTVDESRIYDISAKGHSMDYLMSYDYSDDYDIYLVNHQTISSFARHNGWNAVREFFKRYYIGIKVVDECHLFFENSLKIDSFSNTFKTIYLTATFRRNQSKENIIYNICYNDTLRYGEQTYDYESKRKHIVMVIVYFRSKPGIGETIKVSTRRGFSVYKYIDYELNEYNNTLVKVLFKLLKDTERLEGKRLILVPKKSTIDLIYNLVKEKYPDKSIGKIYSDNTHEENQESKEKDIIITTAKSSGTGLDIKGLRVMYNLEPIGSIGYADQVRGRLREYAPDKDTFFFYPVDVTIPDSIDMLEKILPVFKRKCKEIIVMKIEDI